MSVLGSVFDTARSRSARIVFPELHDPRVKDAAARLRSEGVAQPVPVVEEPSEGHVTALAANRKLREGVARRLLTRPLHRAAAMVSAGEADAMVAGANAPTRRVIEAASIGIGLADGVSTVSSFFLMVFPDATAMIFADCAVNTTPNARELADIALASRRSADTLLTSTKVALLSYSTGSSGTGPSVDLVREAAEATGFTGPIQADAALNHSIATKKGVDGGGANVLVFPDLDSGNIAYKLVQELTGARAIGPVLQGFRKPVCDLSRGASSDDIVAATAVTIALC